MMRRLTLVGIVMASRFAMAQEVPNINDVYAPRPAYANAAWGPTSDAGEVLDRCAYRIEKAQSLGYDVRIESPGRAEAWGTVLLARSKGDGFDRSRITLQGRTADEKTFFLTIVSAERRILIIDRLQARFVELQQLDETSELGRLLRYLWLPDIASVSPFSANPRFLRTSDQGGEPLYSIHFIDSLHHEHIYGLFSQTDALPRVIDRVGSDDTGIPGIISVRLTRLVIDPPAPSDMFDTSAPEGFSLVDKIPGLSY